MHFQNLEEHYHELLDFLEANHYSPSYIQKFKTVIRNILKDPKRKRWESYRGIYLEYAKSSHSEQYLRHMRTVIGALEQFDIFGKYPNGRRRHSLFGRGSYHLLNQEYQELIDFYCKTEKERGKKLTTIHSEAMNAASFLYAMQKKGNFPEVYIYFMDEETELIPEFFKETQCNYPFQVLNIPKFWELLGNGSTPGVFYLWNGNIIKSFEGIDKNKFDGDALKTALESK